MEFFIGKVKLCPCLWDVNHILYRDFAKRDLAWDRIAEECGMENGQDAKSQWKKLRDSHREAMRRRKTCTGQAAQKFKPWKYEALMDFLMPPVEKIPTNTNSNNLQSSTNDTLNTEDSNINNTDVRAPLSSPESSLQTRRFIDTNRKKQKKLDSDDSSEILQQRGNFRRRLIEIDRRPQDALSSLFNSFYQKTRELPKYLQLRVQREFFESITRAEEEAMSIEQNNTYFSPSSSFATSYVYSSAINTSDSILPEASPDTQSSPTSSSSPEPEDSTQTQSSYVYISVDNNPSSPLPDASPNAQTSRTYARNPTKDPEKP